MRKQYIMINKLINKIKVSKNIIVKGKKLGIALFGFILELALILFAPVKECDVHCEDGIPCLYFDTEKKTCDYPKKHPINKN